jgi:hypothetical protein
MRTIIRSLTLTTALTIAGAISSVQAQQSGPACPPGTAPQTTTHQVCIGRGSVSACYSYTNQTCQPLPPPPPPSPPPPSSPGGRP